MSRSKSKRHAHAWLAAASFAVSLGACDSEPAVLVVDVETNLVPGVEFSSVHVQLDDRVVSIGALVGDDFQTPHRAAEISGVSEGPADLSVLLVDASGATVLRRDIEIVIHGSVGITVVLSRDCVGIECAEPAPGTVATSCVDGRCLPRTCSPLDRLACGTPECTGASDCAVRVECASPACADGICLAFGDASRCATGELCHPEGGCEPVPSDRVDADGDGVVDDVDCDPADPSVGFRSERACEGECASGLEVCVSGQWLPCDAPADCRCDIGDVRMVSCERCGRATQTCETGVWATGPCEGQGECSAGSFDELGTCGRCGSDRRTCLDDCSWDEPTCTNEGECTAGASESDEESCGTCGQVRTRMRSCGPTCNWGPWSAFSACAAGGGCTPDQVETQMQACGACGTQARTRTCGADCVFGAWTAWSACAGEGTCVPSTLATEMSACGSCGAGSQVRTQTCTAACVFGPWSGYSTCSVPAAVSVATAQSAACLVASDGTLRCWGGNDTGQLGDGTMTRRATPTRIGTATSWTRVVIAGAFGSGVDYGHACGLRAGELHCWGRNAYGQVGIGSYADAYSPVRIGTASDWTDVAAGRDHTCAIRAGELYCWGRNTDSQLGTGGSTVNVPTRVGSATTWAHVSCGVTHTCGIQTDGALYCWGDNAVGELGLGDRVTRAAPAHMGTETWSSVSCGNNYTCAIRTSGELYCWGGRGTGQLGSMGSSNEDLPVRVGTASDWTFVGAGQGHTCAIRAPGTLYCFGDGVAGECGVLPARDQTLPIQVGTDADFTWVASGTLFTCAVRAGSLYCWGQDGNERLGNGPGSTPSNVPAESCF